VNDTEWLLIAEFARRCRLPVSTLRYYDRVQLLTPAAVDPVTGYRRYHLGQLPAAVTIARLRAVGTTPEAIACILRGGQAAASALADERRRLTDEITERTRSLAHLDELSGLTSFKPGVPQYVNLPPMRVPALGFHADFAALTATIIRGIATLRAQLRSHQLLPPDTEWGALLPLDLDEYVTGHVFARTSTDTPTDGLTTIALPHGPAFEITHHGSDDHLAHTYDRALTAVHLSALRPAGAVIEDYLAPPRQDSPPRVRICVQVGVADDSGSVDDGDIV
jgi:DNA-binding transcriptional MerR regulator